VRMRLPAMCLAAVLAACAQQSGPPYTPPEDYGLVSVRPYPTPADVCQVIGESPPVAEYLDDASLLIGCPTHEAGAMEDRRGEGAVPVGLVGRWMLFSVPLR